MRTILVLCTLTVALGDFFSDWANGPCPSPFPAHSYYCSSFTQTSNGVQQTFHRHKCYSVDGTDNHYCGSECDEICTVLQGGGATDQVCPGACVNGVCKAEGTPVSAHCYCNAGWTGVHCTISTGTSSPPSGPVAPPPPPTDYCRIDEFTGLALSSPQNCNQGTCTNGASSYSCTCNAGWKGFYCLTPTSGATQPEAGTWQKAILDKHNQVRSNIKSATNNEEPNAQTVKNLVWDNDLAENARKWAATGKAGIFTCSGLAHSPGPYRSKKGGWNNIGENLWAAGSSGTDPIDPVTAVQSWVSEYSDFDLNSNTCTSGKMCGHYTQVVWANSQALGCALTTVPCSSFTWTVVACQYGEAGNYVGQKPYVAVADGVTTVVA